MLKSFRHFMLPTLSICLLLAACTLNMSTASPSPQASLPPVQATLPTGQATASMAPVSTASGAPTGGTLDPCMLITTDQVTALLGSAPTPTTGVHADTGFHYCYFNTGNGVLEMAALGTPNAATQFASAIASFQSAPGYKKMDVQGGSIAFSGGPATNGNGTQALIAALIKGNSLATVKLDSKSYTFNADQASTLLESILARLP